MGVLAPPAVFPSLEAADAVTPLSSSPSIASDTLLLLRRRVLETVQRDAGLKPALRAQRLLTRCGLTLGRIEASGVDLPGATPVAGPPGAAWVALDRLGRPWRVCHLDGGAAGGGPELRVALEELMGCVIAGDAWPLWLAPELARVLPVGGGERAAAEALREELEARGVPAGLDDRGPLAGRVRRAELERVPCAIVLGPRELARETLSLRWTGREGATETCARAAAIERLVAARRDTTSFFGAGASAEALRDPTPTSPTGGYRHSAS